MQYLSTIARTNCQLEENMKKFKLLFLTLILSYMASSNASSQAQLNLEGKILIWDTVTAKNKSNYNFYLSENLFTHDNVKAMKKAKLNFIVVGEKTPITNEQNFNPERLAITFINLIRNFPINGVVFSPDMKGLTCFAIIKRPDEVLDIRKLHEEISFKKYIGKFKKPDLGMLIALKALTKKEFKVDIDQNSAVIIINSWHDKAAAEEFNIPFIRFKYN